jgi:hypothetical protein
MGRRAELTKRRCGRRVIERLLDEIGVAGDGAEAMGG